MQLKSCIELKYVQGNHILCMYNSEDREKMNAKGEQTLSSDQSIKELKKYHCIGTSLQKCSSG